MRGTTLRSLLVGPLLALAFGGGLIALPFGLRVPPSAAVLEGNLPVNAGATDLRDVSAHNSPTLVRNPRDGANLAVANRIDTPSFSCALHISVDGGASWTQTAIPVPAGEEPKCYAPDVVFGKDGTLYLSFVTLQGLQNVPNAVWIARSSDRGRTLSDPVKALGPLAFQVRLMADPASDSGLYLTWLQAAETAVLAFPKTGNPIQIARSTDGGSSWSAPARVSGPRRHRVVAPAPAIGPGGSVYVAFLDLGNDKLDYEGAHAGKGGDPYQGKWQLILSRSESGLAGWKETVVESSLVPTERFIVFIPPSPSLAIDQEDGNLYTAFHDGRSGDADVLIWTSRDRGVTFRDPVRVNDNPRGDKTSQYLPKLSIGPTGRLDAIYYDRRSDRKNVRNEVSLQSSFDRGETFTQRLRLSDTSFSSRVGPGIESDLPDLGTRLGLVSTRDKALAVWTDTRAGTELSKKQDVVRAFVQINPPQGPPDLVQRTALLLGAATGLGGLLVLIGRLLSLFRTKSADPIT